MAKIWRRISKIIIRGRNSKTLIINELFSSLVDPNTINRIVDRLCYNCTSTCIKLPLVHNNCEFIIIGFLI